MHAQQVLLEGPSITESKFPLQNYVYTQQQDARINRWIESERYGKNDLFAIYNCAFE